jgi:2-keto-4-pentenoate hydratase/2-oxohepta-3-ene-1,7-dioic acid hydratase in catechol pathway
MNGGWGIVVRDSLLDTRNVTQHRSLLELIRAGDWVHDLKRTAGLAEEIPLGSTRLAAPIPHPPGDMIALGLNYRPHAGETGFTLPSRPILFAKANTSLIGHEEPIVVDPTVTQQVDWEVELVIVIGRGGRDIRAGNALEHVFGYTIANDVSARDLQFADGGQWYRGKSLDGFCPMGPWIVTIDEIPDPADLTLELRVNGVIKQQDSTSQLVFTIPEIIESVSAARTLRPGDLILTGTPGGVGFARKPPEFLLAGDVVDASIQGIGTLRNQVKARTGAATPEV